MIIEQRLMGRASSRVSKTRKKEEKGEMSRAGGQCSRILDKMFDVMVVLVRRGTMYLLISKTELYEPVLTALWRI